MKKVLALLLCALAVQVGAQKINPNTQINWPVPGGVPWPGVASNGPRVDVRTFGADPTGVNYSDNAFASAYAFAISNPSATGPAPAIYIPVGKYKLAQTLRITKYVSVVGDGAASTFLLPDSGSQNVISVITPLSVPGLSGATPPLILQDFAIVGQGHLNSGDAIELDNVQNVNVSGVHVSNWGGRAFNCFGSCERILFLNDQTDGTKNSYESTYQSNEVRFLNFQVMFPGQDAAGYCWSLTCQLNGNKEPAPFSQPLASTSWTANTLIPQGTVISDGANNEYAVVGGITGATVPTWPAAGSTVTESVTINTSNCSTATGGNSNCPVTWKNIANWSLFYPDHHCVVNINGQSNVIIGGSWKGLTELSGLCISGGSLSVKGLYLEAPAFSFSSGGQTVSHPSINSGIIVVGSSEQTLCTSSVAASSIVLPCPDTGWFPNYLGNPADAIVSNTPYNMLLVPPDYVHGSTTQSAFEPAGVAQGAVEMVRVGAFAGDGNAYLTSTGRCQSGSTFPQVPGGPTLSCTANSATGIAWSKGTTLALASGSAPGGNPIISNIHLNVAESQGGNGQFGACSDTGVLKVQDSATGGNVTHSEMCADGIIGGLPDQKINGTLAQVGASGAAPFQQSGTIEDLGGDFMAAPNEPWGGGMYKVAMQGSYLSHEDKLGGATLSAPAGADVGQGSVNISQPTIVYANDPVSGRNACGIINRVPYGIYSNVCSGTYTSQYRTGVAAIGQYVANEYDLMDIGPGTSTQSMNRVHFVGGPNNSSSGAFEFDTWNGSNWAAQGGINTSGIYSTAINGAQIGATANYVQNSTNIAGSGWLNANPSSAPTLAITCGQPDPFGGNNACHVSQGAWGGGSWQYTNTSTSSFSLVSSTACIYLKGDVGGESYSFDDNPTGIVTPQQTVAMTNGWLRYSYTGVPINNHIPFRFGGFSALPAEGYTVYEPHTQNGPSCGPPLNTTTSMLSPSSVVSAQQVNVGGDPAIGATTSTPSGTCTANGFITATINGSAVKIATCAP